MLTLCTISELETVTLLKWENERTADQQCYCNILDFNIEIVRMFLY